MILYRLLWLCDFELCGMVKRKYPCLIVMSPEIIISVLLCPTLWSVTSEYPPIVSLNDSECGSFVETVVMPWLHRVFIDTPLIDSVQSCKFIVKTFHKECFMLVSNQIFWGSQWKWLHFSLFTLALSFFTIAFSFFESWFFFCLGLLTKAF